MPINEETTPLFDYDLPRELIAQEPLKNRTDARLMIVDRATQTIEHRYFRDLPQLLTAGDRLVLNDTKVLPAQLIGKRLETGGNWQGLFLGGEANGDWRIVCKTRGKLKVNEAVMLVDREGRDVEKLWLLERLEAGQWIAHPESEASVEEVLSRVGRLPLPHYIRDGQMTDADVVNYQTVFAKNLGAVAAPTAGLHFTENLLREIRQQEVDLAAVTLHVGLGTFRPIADKVEDHIMHSEWCQLSESAAEKINQTKTNGGRVIAVGTTSVRTLETAAMRSTVENQIAAWEGETDIFIKPPYKYQAVDALITNFHFPRTTLLLLVEALCGTKLLREAYEQAVEERYRFYSYGDAMMIV